MLIILKINSSDKNVFSFGISSTGTFLSQIKKFFLSLINPHKQGQYRLLNVIERNGIFASNKIKSNKNETQNLMMKKIFAKNIKKIKLV